MDYMDLNVDCLQKAYKLNHLLTPIVNLRWSSDCLRFYNNDSYT